MSRVIFNSGAAPSAPAAGKASMYVDSSDRIARTIDEKGVISELVNNNGLNEIRNSGMWYVQRQGASATTYSSVGGRLVTADSWYVSNENASVTVARTDTQAAPEAGLQGRFYMNLLKITNLGKMHLAQINLGTNTTKLRGRTVRVQFWAKQLVAATPVWRFGLISWTGTTDAVTSSAGNYISAWGANSTDPTLGATLAYVAPKAGISGDNCTISGNAASATLSASWQRFGAVFDVPAAANNIIVAFWSDSQVTATNGIAISQVSLTDGYEIQAWTPLPRALEFYRVSRYYAKTFAVDTLPAASVGLATGELRIPSPVGASTAMAAAWTWQFPFPMARTPATLTLYNPAAAGAQVRNGTLSTDCTSSSITANGPDRAFIICTTPASTVAGTNILAVHATADAEL